MTLQDWIDARGAAFDAAARPWTQKSALRRGVYEALVFVIKQAWACLFGISMLLLLSLTHAVWPAGAPLARYDFMVFAALAIQAFLLLTRLERPEEAVVIGLFHVTGTVMEIFKVAHGSWLYPEPSLIRLWGVPLFSGFMYGSVGSHFARATRLFDVGFARYPPIWATWLLAVAAYLNFFTHHFSPDIRLGLFAFSLLIFGRTSLQYTVLDRRRRLPMLAAFLGVAFALWIAENVATSARTWIYPSQSHGWRMVPLTKMGAWYLLMLLSFVLVTVVHRPRRIAAPIVATVVSEAPPEA